MTRTRLLGLCIIAVFATVAGAAASASALPEWGQCYPSPGGKYEDSNCTRKAHPISTHGHYEWRHGVDITSKDFTSAGGPSVLAASYTGGPMPGLTEVECSSETATGEIAGTNQVKSVELVFQGCQVVPSGPTCSNTLNTGEIQWSLLKGKLGYIAGAHSAFPTVGVNLTPESIAPRPRPFVEFKCGTVSVLVGIAKTSQTCAYPGPKCGGDGIISPITPVNEMTVQFTGVYSTTAFENIPSQFETGPLKELESRMFETLIPANISGWSKTGETLTRLTTPLPVGAEWEIKA